MTRRHSLNYSLTDPAGGKKTQVGVNFGSDKVDVETNSDGDVTLSFDTGAKISMMPGEMDPNQLLFARKQEVNHRHTA